MNFREWIYPFALAAAISFTIQYFLISKKDVVENTACSGQSFVAPTQERLQKPLQKQIEFETRFEKEIDKHVVTTQLAKYVFSSKGAVIDNLDFFWQSGSKMVEMMPLNSDCLLVALEDKTPLFYDFVGEQDNDDTVEVSYKASMDHMHIVKTFVIHKKTYQVDLRVSLDYGNKNNQLESIRVFLPAPVLLVDAGTVDLKALVNKTNCGMKAMKFEDIDLGKVETFNQFWFEPKVFGFANKFMVQALIGSMNNVAQRGYLKGYEAKDFAVIIESQPIAHGETLEWSFYFGPKAKESLEAVAPFLSKTLDYGMFSFIAKPMLSFLITLKDLFGNYGIAIILLTLLLKLMLLPFALSGEKSMRQQAEFQKKLAYIKQKYKGDKEAMDRANAELIQKHGIPGMSGCLPMFLNIPFFFSLNRILSTSIELYGAKFLWLQDLSAKDPYYILGILTGICMFCTPMGNDPKQALMRYMFALIFGTITTYLSSGLALFIFVNILLGLVQTYFVKKFISSR